MRFPWVRLGPTSICRESVFVSPVSYVGASDLIWHNIRTLMRRRPALIGFCKQCHRSGSQWPILGYPWSKSDEKQLASLRVHAETRSMSKSETCIKIMVTTACKWWT